MPPEARHMLIESCEEKSMGVAMARKVLIERTQGGPHPNFPVGTIKQGWELSPPRTGDSYLLFTDSGAVFRTSKIIRITNNSFHTKNSVYKILVLEEEPGKATNQSRRTVLEPVNALGL